MKLLRMTDTDETFWGLWDETSDQWVETRLAFDEARAVVLSWGFPRSLELPTGEGGCGSTEIVRPEYAGPDPIEKRYSVDIVIRCENAEGESVEWSDPDTLCGPTTEEGAEAFVNALVKAHGDERTPLLAVFPSGVRDVWTVYRAGQSIGQVMPYASEAEAMVAAAAHWAAKGGAR